MLIQRPANIDSHTLGLAFKNFTEISPNSMGLQQLAYLRINGNICRTCRFVLFDRRFMLPWIARGLKPTLTPAVPGANETVYKTDTI